jgi:type II secretory pathway component PulK
MNKHSFGNRNKNKGGAFIVVLIALVVVSILTAALASLVNSNLKMAKHTENSLRAYYLALSGVDITVAALLKQTIEDTDLTDTLSYTRFQTGSSPITETISIDDGAGTVLGTVVVTVTASGTLPERWVNIEAVATMADSGQTARTKMRYLVMNPAVQVREAS